MQSCGIHWNPVPFRWIPLDSTGFHRIPPEWLDSDRNRGGHCKVLLTAPAPCNPSTPCPRDTTGHASWHHLLKNCKQAWTDTRACERIDEWRTRLRHIKCKTWWWWTRMVDARDGAKCCMGRLREWAAHNVVSMGHWKVISLFTFNIYYQIIY